MVKELVQRGVAGRDLVEIVVELTGLPLIQPLQLIACEQGFDIPDAVGRSPEVPERPKTS